MVIIVSSGLILRQYQILKYVVSWYWNFVNLGLLNKYTNSIDCIEWYITNCKFTDDSKQLCT